MKLTLFGSKLVSLYSVLHMETHVLVHSL